MRDNEITVDIPNSIDGLPRLQRFGHAIRRENGKTKTVSEQLIKLNGLKERPENREISFGKNVLDIDKDVMQSH